ncbi:MAG: hypothetical protein GX451_06510 [Acholeplasmataceae bacterium]|nr:hypothetical protein [Acholeplasmataceae bacterium]
MEDNEKYEEEDEEDYVNNVLKCPFCGCIIAEEGYLDSIDSCGHLAFFGAWGYEEFNREKRKWSKELTKIIRKLGNEDYTRMEKLQDVILSPSLSGYENLKKSIQNIVSDDIEVAINSMYIECGQGEHGGGPTFVGLFMKKKTT